MTDGGAISVIPAQHNRTLADGWVPRRARPGNVGGTCWCGGPVRASAIP